jgi:GT2 family glycosyltransferase
MSAEPKVTVITLSWNRKLVTLEWLESVFALNYSNYDVLVVDNGSSDDSVAAIREQFPEATVIENGENLGYTRGFNIGLEHAFRNGADYALVMNNDAVIDPEALRELVNVAEGDPRIGFVSGKVYNYFRPDEFETVGTRPHPILVAGAQIGEGKIDRGQYDEIAEREITDDVFLLARKAVFESVGGYDPDFFLVDENVDWCLRVRRAGFRIMYTPKAKLWHKGRGGEEWRPYYVYHSIRSHFVLIAKHLPRLKSILAALLLAFYYQPYALLFYLKPKTFSLIGAYLGGQVAGFAWLLQHLWAPSNERSPAPVVLTRHPPGRARQVHDG